MSSTADTAIPVEWLRVSAYFLAERRGFGLGHALEDWLAAEKGLPAGCEVSAATPATLGK